MSIGGLGSFLRCSRPRGVADDRSKPHRRSRLRVVSERLYTSVPALAEEQPLAIAL